MEVFVKTIRLGFGRTLPPCPCGIWQGEEPWFQLVGVQVTLSSPQILAVFKKKHFHLRMEKYISGEII